MPTTRKVLETQLKPIEARIEAILAAEDKGLSLWDEYTALCDNRRAIEARLAEEISKPKQPMAILVINDSFKYASTNNRMNKNLYICENQAEAEALRYHLDNWTNTAKSYIVLYRPYFERDRYSVKTVGNSWVKSYLAARSQENEE